MDTRKAIAIVTVGAVMAAGCGGGEDVTPTAATTAPTEAPASTLSTEGDVSGPSVLVVVADDDIRSQLRPFHGPGVTVVTVAELPDVAPDFAFVAIPSIDDAGVADLEPLVTVGAAITLISRESLDANLLSSIEALGADPLGVLAILLAADDGTGRFEVADVGLTERVRLLTGVDESAVSMTLGIDLGPPSRAGDEVAAEEIPAAEKAWGHPVPAEFAYRATSSVLADDMLITLGGDGVVYALDATTGAEIWTNGVATAEVGPGTTLQLAGDLVIGSLGQDSFDTPYPGLYALDIRTGEQKWTNLESGTHPTVVEDVVYQWMAEDYWTISYAARDVATGELLWRTRSPNSWEGDGRAIHHDGVIYAGNHDGRLYGFDQATGDIVFEYVTPAEARVAMRPAVVDDHLLFGSGDGVFRSLDLTTREVRWDFTTEVPWLESSPAIADGLVVFGSMDGNLQALDVGTGALRWSTSLGPATPGVASSPAIADGVVYVAGAADGVYAVALETGEVLWRHDTEGIFVSDTPVVGDGLVYIQVPNEIVALRTATLG